MVEIADRFVLDVEFAKSTTRPKIWQDWNRAVQLLTDAVLVYSVWISGSFVTDKRDPDDIDAVFIISLEDLLKRPAADFAVVESFNRRVMGPLGRPVPAHGLRVDSFIIRWAPHNGDPARDATYGNYCGARGYWDDFWSRERVTPKSLPPKRVDALPSRGYLEVNLNAYA